MKNQDFIPTTKVARAGKFATTGLKIGGNVIKHYAKRMANNQLDRTQLHEENASDVYNLLSTLKGGALKVAQMLSMDNNLLPEAYSKKFQLSQYSAPPLSAPLVNKTFKKYLGKSPHEIFDSFDSHAKNAASIGQVHRAEKDGKKLAVKIQYPGVKESLKTDLMIAKPMASRLMGISMSEIEKYIGEVELKLLEETDYELELNRSIAITQKLSSIHGVVFPTYYPEYSGKRVITMDWLDGIHLSEFYDNNPTQEERNHIGQILWDFYSYQIHVLKEVHADPHPGNFLVTPNGDLGVLDFGCIKEIPESFYKPYFKLMEPGILQQEEILVSALEELDLLRTTDSNEDRALLKDSFTEMIGLLSTPMSGEVFDFGDKAFFTKLVELGETYSKNPKLKKLSGRGNHHAIYVNRTFFGLFNLLHQLGATVKTSIPKVNR